MTLPESLRDHRPPPLYPRRTLLAVLAVTTLLVLAVVGLTITQLFSQHSISDLSTTVKTNSAERHKEIAALRRADQSKFDRLLEDDRRLRDLLRSNGIEPGPRFGATPTAPEGATRTAPSSSASRRSSPAPSRSPSSKPRPSQSPPPTPRPTPGVIPGPVRSAICDRTHICVADVGYRTTPSPAADTSTTLSAGLHDVLDTTGPDSAAINALRYLVVFLGAILTGLFLGSLWRRDGCREGRWLFSSLALTLLPIWLTEAEQIGQPWLYWRLPLAIVAIVAVIGTYGVHRVYVHGEFPRWWPRRK